MVYMKITIHSQFIISTMNNCVKKFAYYSFFSRVYKEIEREKAYTPVKRNVKNEK